MQRKRKGAVLVLMTIMLPVVLLLAAFAVNFAYMELNRTELYCAADAAARAGGREFTVTRSQAQARIRGKALAALNEVAGTPLTLSDSDFVFGAGNRPTLAKYNFTPGGSNPNALQVTARRTVGAADGPIPLLMPNAFGIGSFEAEQSSISTQVDVDISLVIDRSGSMAYAVDETAAYPPAPAAAPYGWSFCDPVPPNSRWLDMVAAVNVFLTELSSSPSIEHVALSTYNENAVTNQHLTSDYSLILNQLDLYTNNFCSGGTNIGGGINEGASTLALSSRPTAIKVIVVLTDGIHNIGDSPIDAADTAAVNGVIIHTVTFSNEADTALMQNVANRGGGQHFHTNNPTDLIAIFSEIAKHLPNLLTR